jgi:hypothetical protein
VDSARNVFRGSIGCPDSVVNTWPVSVQAVPACSRSATWALRCALSRSTTPADSGSDRRDGRGEQRRDHRHRQEPRLAARRGRLLHRGGRVPGKQPVAYGAVQGHPQHGEHSLDRRG